MFSSLKNTKKENKLVTKAKLLTSTPFWFQKRMFKSKKGFKISNLKNLLNKEIIIKAQELQIKKLENFKEQNRLRVMDDKRIINEKLYMINFKKFLKTVSFVALKYTVHLNIFGGIIGKIINPEFKLNEYDIDMFFSSSVPITLDKFIYIISQLEKDKIIFNSNLIIDNSNNISSYNRIRNRPGMKNIHLVKAQTYFNGIGFIDLDILSGSPKTSEIDCTISNLCYNASTNQIKSLNSSIHLGIIDTLFDLRHKTGELLIKNNENGLNNISRYILISSRQKKYEMQGWNIINKLEEINVPDDWLCPVCYENIKQDNYAVKFKCSDKHIFCKNCLVTMINCTTNINKNKCPLCRAKIEVNFNFKKNIELEDLKLKVKKKFNFKSKKLIRINARINNYNNSNEQIDTT
jgi:hypothetical protein